MTIHATWPKAKERLATKMAVENTFQSGATELDLSSLKKLVGVDIPEDFISLYMMNNGQKPGADS